MNRRAGIVKCVLVLSMLLSGFMTCAEEEPESHFGHGAYHCFYENKKGKIFSGRAGDRKKSMRQAKAACFKTYPHPVKAQCKLVDCRFK